MLNTHVHNIMYMSLASNMHTGSTVLTVYTTLSKHNAEVNSAMLSCSHTIFSTPEEESQSVQLAKLKCSLQSVDWKRAVVPAIQLTHLLSYASIAVH